MTSDPTSTDRLAGARRVLDEAGIAAPVRVTGAEGEIATVTGPASLRDALVRLVPKLQALGFTYVALELEHDGRMSIQDS